MKEAPSNRAEELFDLLAHSVKMCSVSDRPVGAFLSGGVDSTTVAYFLSQYHPQAPLFSLHWDDPDYSEESYTQQTAAALRLNHHAIQCDDSFWMRHFETVVGLYDEPFADESMVPTYCLAGFAKSHVDVVLTGDGADEFFMGYERYFFEGDDSQYLDVFAATSTETHRLICHPDFLAQNLQSPFLPYYLQQRSLTPEKRLRSLIDIKTYLPDDILMKVDRACMGVSLENRAPFLTPAVTDFALQSGLNELVGHKNRGKEILRAAMGRVLPPIVLERKKMGFGVPLNRWFRSSLKEWMVQRLLEGSLVKTGWFSREGIQTLIANHLARHGNYARSLLNLLVLEVWLRKHQGLAGFISF